MRGCGRGKGICGLALIAAGALLLIISLPIKFWIVVLGCGLILAGLLLLGQDC